MPSISSSRLNDEPIGGSIRPANSADRSQAKYLHDGKDQVFVRANGSDYVIEGESLNLKALKQGVLPRVSVTLEGIEYPATIQSVDNEAQGFTEHLQHSFQSAPEGWGKPSQIAGTVNELADLKGNRDGLWHNEKAAPGTTGGFFSQNPLALKGRAALESNGQVDNQVETLTKFRMGQEAKWGQSVTHLDITHLKDGELFAVQKALALTRMERTPSDVTEGFVRAAGKVNGHDIAERELFWQRFQPVGEASGKLVVMFPGFLQSGRNFYEQVAELNREGHDVMVMDQQWAGQTRGGKEGGVDRGYGVSRDVAAMTAFAQQELEADYADHPGKELILIGTSLGGGPGVVGALTMNQNGLMDLEGPAMPTEMKVILQGPFLGSTDNINNTVFSAASKIPLANQIPLPSTGLPILTTDEKTAQKISQGAVMEDFTARLQAMTAVNEDMDEVLHFIAEGKGSQVPMVVIHSKNDPLASSEKSQWLANQLPQASIKILDSENHVLEQNTQEQKYALEALKTLVRTSH